MFGQGVRRDLPSLLVDLLLVTSLGGQQRMSAASRELLVLLRVTASWEHCAAD